MWAYHIVCHRAIYNHILQDVKWLMAVMNVKQGSCMFHVLYKGPSGCVCTSDAVRLLENNIKGSVWYKHTGPLSRCIFTQPRRWGWRMHRATRKAQTLWWPQRQSWLASIQSWWTAAGSGLTFSPETPASPHFCSDREKQREREKCCCQCQFQRLSHICRLLLLSVMNTRMKTMAVFRNSFKSTGKTESG